MQGKLKLFGIKKHLCQLKNGYCENSYHVTSTKKLKLTCISPVKVNIMNLSDNTNTQFSNVTKPITVKKI